MSITETQLLLEQGKKACYETFEHDKALNLYEEAIAISPDFANAYAEKANVLRYQYKYQEALDFANKAIDLDENCWLGHFQKVRALAGLQKTEEAEEFFTNFIADFYLRNPNKYDNNEEFLFQLATILCELKHYTEAIESFDELIKIDSNKPIYYNNKASCFYYLKEYEKAIECVTKAIELNPNYANAYHSKANCFYCLERYEEALEYCTKAIELNFNDPVFYNTKANCFYYLKEYEKAIECSNKAIELNPNYANAYNSKARALEKIGLKQDK
jgi:tetratricopeptide (TPR) repeat protein